MLSTRACQSIFLAEDRVGLFFFILLTHEGSHREVYQVFQPSCDIFRRSCAKGCSDHRFRAPPACTAQLLTLHQHRANNQYRTLFYLSCIPYCVQYWDRYYSVQILRNNTLELNIRCCFLACLFPTSCYSSARRILNIALYVRTYGHNIHGTLYTELTKTSPNIRLKTGYHQSLNMTML